MIRGIGLISMSTYSQTLNVHRIWLAFLKPKRGYCPRVSRRWRAQQNAKWDANCRNSWVITFLNAIGTQAMSLGMNEGVRVDHIKQRILFGWWGWTELNQSSFKMNLFLTKSLEELIEHHLRLNSINSNQHTYPSSFHSRLPAEFKHINQRWKRNQLGYPQ
jgi:hypothetical protein